MKFTCFISLILFLLSTFTYAAETPTTKALWEIIQQQQTEIESLKQQQSNTNKTLKDNERKIEVTADAIEQTASLGSKATEWAAKTKIGGYGEHHYNRIDDQDDQVDAHRFVLYISHEYTDTVRFFSEFELEHGLAGEGKPGEVELEQAYIEWDYSNKHRLVAGQFLIPVGILNEVHEPDTYYGTERNQVEKNIIPTTWWETGILFRGEIIPGLSYDLAVHSGLNTTEANIRSGRQKSAKAIANNLASTARVKYTGIPGLELAATVQHQEDLTQDAEAAATATLAETHLSYQTGPFQFRALWAAWDIDGSAAEASGRDEQVGYYIEPGFKVTDSLGFFVRVSSVDNTAGLDTSDSVDSVDYGLNYWLTPTVVAKADITNYDDDDGNDSVNLGLGWSF